ncbi:hypothetical protein [Allopusillimonas ginsengisoli]|uniref:hypothetical protein n=1 Tax=Allopusillimonas ginsengisoli TaxID=453575 RepID=UPI0010226B6D|nr:hypothetical protein [Allopusillimonas ginsengisoli]TEA78688.1 hypothetical protein ERE07_09850 [Allopusillimonas ginsengisoli]
MTQLKVAHIREHGRDLIIIPLDSSFHDKSRNERKAALKAMQECVSSAGLDGIIVPVWRAGHNRYFIAPEEWHSFIKTLSWHTIISRLNKLLVCD